MKKFNIAVLFVTLFLLTGCEATYNLDVTEEGMTESVSLLTDNNITNKKTVDNVLNSSYSAYYDMNLKKDNNYQIKEIKHNDKIGLNFEYSYSGDTLQNSAFLNRCYYQKSVIKNGESIIIYTDGKTNCFYKDGKSTLDKLTVKVKTDLEVIKNNADEIKKNTYIWYINKNNFSNKPISIEMKIPEKEDEKTSHWWSEFLILFGIIIVLAVVTLLHIYLKGKNNNKL